jgi:formate hydrogenlyase subunit 6/NADH:ubiquinone oxidoreductase subunit I
MAVDITTHKPPRKKEPKEVAVVHQSGCTGCEACIAFCPVDCIEIVPGLIHPAMNRLVEIDLDRCIGCKLCAKYCPWETIDMLPYGEGLALAPKVTARSVCGQEALAEADA